MDDPLLARWASEMTADGYSPRTVRARLHAVTCFARAAGVDPADLDREHVLAYLGGRPLAVRTRRSYLSHLQAWGRWSGRPGLVEGIRRPPQPRGVPRPITEAQLSRLMLAARPGHRERAYLVLGAYAGLRAFETAKVRAEDLEQHGTWGLRVEGKGGQLALVPVPDVVVEALRPWVDAVDGRGRLWPQASGDSVRNTLRTLGVRAGVRFTSHQLRHRYGTAYYRQTRDVFATRAVMRHASIATTENYVLIVDDEVAAAVHLLPGATGTRGPGVTG